MLTAILVLAASYFIASIIFVRFRLSFVLVSGAEYVLLGILLGPHAAGILTSELLDVMAPIASLGLGWIGALLGARLVLRQVVRVPAVLYGVALAESLTTLSAVSVLMWLLLTRYSPLPNGGVIVAALSLGMIAITSARVGTSRVARRQMEIAGDAAGAVAVTAFGVMLALLHTEPTAGGASPSPVTWIVMTVAIGVVSGVLFHLFLGQDHAADRIFVALFGGVTLASGAATYLALSPILSGMCFGMVLANSGRDRRAIVAALERVERPLYLALLLCGGALWGPSVDASLACAIAYVVVRTLARYGAVTLAAQMAGLSRLRDAAWERSLGQGGLALAIALNYRFQDVLPLSDLLFAAVLGSLLATDLLTARTSPTGESEKPAASRAATASD